MAWARAALAFLLAVAFVGISEASTARPVLLRQGKSEPATLRLRGGGIPFNPMTFVKKCLGQTAGPKIIIAGAPASGKGTQCEYITKQYGVVHISTGDALREQVREGTELGKMAEKFMSKGDLVPDSVIIGIVKARLAKPDCRSKGWLLDGFPRTKGQAEAMVEEGIKADKCIFLQVPDKVLIERCEGRRTDPETGAIYHLKFNPPPEDAEVRRRLVHRSDDTRQAMVKRLEQYHKNVGAIRDYYKDISKDIDGEQDKSKVAEAVRTFIDL